MKWRQTVENYKYGIGFLLSIALLAIIILTLTFLPTILPDQPQPPEQNTTHFYVQENKTVTLTFLPKYQYEIQNKGHKIDSITIKTDNTQLETHSNITHPEQPEELQNLTREEIANMSEEELNELDQLEQETLNEYTTQLTINQYYNETTDQPHTITVVFNYQNGATRTTDIEIEHPKERLTAALTYKNNNDGTYSLSANLTESNLTNELKITTQDGTEITTLTPNNKTHTLNIETVYKDTDNDEMYETKQPIYSIPQTENGTIQGNKTEHMPPQLTPIPKIQHKQTYIQIIEPTANQNTEFTLYTPNGNYLTNPETNQNTNQITINQNFRYPAIQLTQQTPVYLTTTYGNKKILIKEYTPN
jgi:hypothetical protein